jgi:GNAT superfamily N-acetyltransferase
MSLTISPVTPADAEIIAALHTASWQRAYRGILTDAYLDTDLRGEREAVWRSKLREEDGPGWLAVLHNEPVGFVYVRAKADAVYGTLVDNLHVLPAYQGSGIGRQLLHTVGEWTQAHHAHAAVHLWVFAANTPARGFYARMGGREVELVDKLASDGRLLPEYRVAWDRPAALLMPSP